MFSKNIAKTAAKIALRPLFFSKKLYFFGDAEFWVGLKARYYIVIATKHSIAFGHSFYIIFLLYSDPRGQGLGSSRRTATRQQTWESGIRVLGQYPRIP